MWTCRTVIEHLVTVLCPHFPMNSHHSYAEKLCAPDRSCCTEVKPSSDLWTAVFCPPPQRKTPEWWLNTQQKKGCAFLLTLPAPFYQQRTHLSPRCALLKDRMFGPWTVLDPGSQQFNTQLSYLHILTPMCLIFKNSSTEQNCVSQSAKALSVNSDQVSITV